MTLCIITTKYDIFIELCNFIVRLVALCRNLKKLQIHRCIHTYDYVLIHLCSLSSYLYRNTLIFALYSCVFQPFGGLRAPISKIMANLRNRILMTKVG